MDDPQDACEHRGRDQNQSAEKDGPGLAQSRSDKRRMVPHSAIERPPTLVNQVVPDVRIARIQSGFAL
jgi:hypothetical protein